MKEIRLSVSQLKTFNKSPAEWAGKYILGIKDDGFQEDALVLGNMFEHWLFTGEDKRELAKGKDISDHDKLRKDYEALKHNAEGLEFEPGKTQYKVEGELFGKSFLGYVDSFNEDCIDDIKTTQYLTKQDATNKNFWSGMTTYEEYAVQLYVYMKLTGIRKARIIEIAKHKYKEEDRHEHQILEFELNNDMEMTIGKKVKDIIDGIDELSNKLAYINENRRS